MLFSGCNFHPLPTPTNGPPRERSARRMLPRTHRDATGRNNPRSKNALWTSTEEVFERSWLALPTTTATMKF